MSVRDQLYADVCAAPHDEAPRRILADWLEDQGDPQSLERAEFIRGQLAAPSLPAGSRELGLWQRREQELLVRHGAAWSREAPGWARGRGVARFRRGFVEDAECKQQVFLKEGEELARRIPLRGLVLRSTRRIRLVQLSGSPLLERLAHMEIHSPDFHATDLSALLGSSHLRGLQSLRLAGRLGPYAGGWPLASGRLAGLVELAIFSCGPVYRFSEALGRLGGVMRLLERLTIREAVLRDDDVRALLGGLSGTGLRLLDLSGNQLGPAGARTVARWVDVARLEELALGGNALGDQGALALAGSAPLAGLQVLRLDGNGIGPEGLSALLASHLTNLTVLDLAGNGLGDEGAAALAGWPGLARIFSLNLSGCRIGPAGARALADSPHTTGLLWLDLSFNRIGEAGAQALRGARQLRGLKGLDLRHTGAGPEQAAS